MFGSIVKTKEALTAIYTRVSTDDQAREGFSLNAQKELLRKFAKDNDCRIVAEYEDGGFSGTVLERPALQQLLSDAREGKFAVLLVYKFDRFFRKNKLFLATLEELESLGVAIKSVTEPFDSSTPMGKFMLNMIGGMAELERNTIVERSKMGKQRRYKEGFYAGGTDTKTKYGYNYDKEKKELSINEDEAVVIRLIFDEYIKPDSSLVKVAKKLRDLGYKTKTGLNFESDRVQEILRSSMYVGTWYANKLSVDKELKKQENWIAVKVPRIIEQSVFDRAQQLLDQRRTYVRREMKYDYLLQGMITCADCGCQVTGTADNKSVTVKNGKKYGPYLKLYYRSTYWLKNTFEKRINCGLKYIQAEVIEKLVWGKVDAILQNPGIVAQAVMSKENISESERQNIVKTAEQLKKNIEKSGKEEQRLVEAYRQEVISIEQLKPQLEDIKAKQTEWKKALEEATMRLDSMEANHDIQDAVSFIEKVKKGIDKFNFSTKRKLLQTLNTKIVVNINGLVDLFFCLPRMQRVAYQHSFPVLLPEQYMSSRSAGSTSRCWRS